MIENKNVQLLENLSYANEEKWIEIKKYLGTRFIVIQKSIFHLAKNIFITVNR